MKTPDEIANEIVMTHTGLYALEKDRERMVERIAAAIRAYATGARAMTGPTSNLRQSVAIVIADALGEGIHYERPGFQRAADASIAAYRAHPAGAAADRHPTERALNNLLAIIHRDGGHHTGNVGINTSVKDAHLVWAELITRAENAEAERDEARAQFNDIDLCLNGVAPCDGLLAAERTAYTAGWIAGRDAAAEVAKNCGDTWSGSRDIEQCLQEAAADSKCAEIVDAIRALTPPEPAP